MDRRIEKIRNFCVMAFIAAGMVALVSESLKKPVVYEGKGEGFYDEIKVKITAERNKKNQVRVSKVEVAHEDTKAIADPAVENLIGQMMTKQDVEKLDVVAGATFTSEGIIEALKDAASKVN